VKAKHFENLRGLRIKGDGFFCGFMGDDLLSNVPFAVWLLATKSLGMGIFLIPHSPTGYQSIIDSEQKICLICVTVT